MNLNRKRSDYGLLFVFVWIALILASLSILDNCWGK